MAGSRKSFPCTSRKQIVDVLKNDYTPPPSETVRNAVNASLYEGKATLDLAEAVTMRLPANTRRLISIGNPEGWDVDFFYCGGTNAATNEAKARLAATALGQMSGERIAPGIVLGNVQVMAREEHDQVADAPTEGEGAIVLTDNTLGKVEAVSAILTTLGDWGQQRHETKESATPKRWYIQFFDCQPRGRSIRDAVTRLRPDTTLRQ